MSHAWAVTFKSADGVKKIFAATDVKVKERRGIVIYPGNQEVHLKLYWLLCNVPDEAVRVALGRVGEVRNDRWRVDGIQDKGSTLRSMTVKLKAGVAVDDLPHELRVSRDKALVESGRAPHCLRCNTKRHIRRECKVPECSSCRPFEHGLSACVRS